MYYKISEKTQIIKNVDNGYYQSKIIEEDGIHYSSLSPATLIDYNCTINGASLEGRAETVKKILGSKTKLPIPVLPFAGIYMLPTKSINNNDCIWLSYYQINKFVEKDKRVLVFLGNHLTFNLNISYNQLDSQYKRTSQVIAYFYRLDHLG